MEILRYLPKSWISYCLGKLAHIELPQVFAQPIIRWFVSRYQVNFSEVSAPIESFPSIGAFFIRELKPGSRPILDTVVSPADSFLRSVGLIPNDGKLVQVKEMTYSAADLLGSTLGAERFKGGSVFNFYLSPKDYHRVHSPVSGKVKEVTHIPGALWPVNDWSLYAINNLFCVNERVVTYIQTDMGLAAVVMVGATNVGRISLKFCDLITNTKPWAKKEQKDILFQPGTEPFLNAGDHLGTFHLGSTVILLLEKEFGQHNNSRAFNTTPRDVKFGQSLFAI